MYNICNIYVIYIYNVCIYTYIYKYIYIYIYICLCIIYTNICNSYFLGQRLFTSLT